MNNDVNKRGLHGCCPNAATTFPASCMGVMPNAYLCVVRMMAVIATLYNATVPACFPPRVQGGNLFIAGAPPSLLAAGSYGPAAPGHSRYLLLRVLFYMLLSVGIRCSRSFAVPRKGVAKGCVCKDRQASPLLVPPPYGRSALFPLSSITLSPSAFSDMFHP